MSLFHSQLGSLSFSPSHYHFVCMCVRPCVCVHMHACAYVHYVCLLLCFLFSAGRGFLKLEDFRAAFSRVAPRLPERTVLEAFRYWGWQLIGKGMGKGWKLVGKMDGNGKKGWG